ncbi:MAG: Stp1/IreP family PP2C-type Ser/Thr phosphatase [Ferrimicrobium sp.]
MTLGYAVGTDVGRVRSDNQDAVFADGTLFVVADGMGGHAGGGVASQVAIGTLADEISKGHSLPEAIAAANAAVYERSLEDSLLEGMGTTLTAACGNESGRVGIYNIGDSRAYLYSKGQLYQLTSDHTFVQELVDSGSITKEQAAIHRARHVLTRALGIAELVVPDAFEIQLNGGDILLLCSDGLINELSDEEIGQVLTLGLPLPETVSRLIDLANAHGGNDNISVVLATLDDGHPGTPESLVVTRMAQSSPQVPLRGMNRILQPIPTSMVERSSWKRALARFGIFVAVIGVFGAAVVLAVSLYVNHSYYVGLAGARVAIYQGRVGGILWFQPHVVRVTSLRTDRLSPAVRSQLVSGVDEGSVAQALRFVANATKQIELSRSATLAGVIVSVVV